MPPPIGAVTGIFKGLVNGIFGGERQEEQQSSQDTNTSTSSVRSHVAQAGGSEGSAYDSARAGGKRAREEQAQQVGTVQKKLRQEDAHTKGLTPNFHTPANATPISMSTYGNNYRPAPQGSAAGRAVPYKNLSRPMNTLNQQPHAAAAPTRTRTPRPTQPARAQGKIDLFRGKQLSTTVSQGSNVQRQSQVQRHASHGDGFEHSPAIKKQKTEHPKSALHTKGDTVDLTSDTEHDADARTRNEEASRNSEVYDILSAELNPEAHPQAQSQIPANPYTFAQPRKPRPADKQPWESANDGGGGKPHKKRKPKGDKSGSQSSSHTPSTSSVGERNRVPGSASHQAAVPVDDSESSLEVLGERKNGKRIINQHGTGWPQINLTKGLDEAAAAHVKQGSAKDHQGASDVLQGVLYRGKNGERRARSASDERAQQRTSLKGAQAQRHRAMGGLPTMQEMTGVPHAQRQEEQRLSKTFKRVEDPLESKPRPKARERMMPDSSKGLSKVSPVGESSSSGDELARGTTVVGKAGRSVSPAKKQVNVRRSGSPSASDLRPTPFTSRRAGSEAAKSTAAAEESSWVPVIAFYSVSCCLVTGDGRLVYDESTGKLELWNGDMPEVVPGKGKNLTVGPLEARTVTLAQGSTRVVLKGAKTDVSNGTICIAFEDPEAVQWFLNTIMLVTRNSTAFDHQPTKLDAMFSHQSQLLERAHKLEIQRAPNRTWLEQSKGRPSPTRQGSEDGSEIRYEDEEEVQPQQKTRSRMQAGETSNVRASRSGAVQSHYFAEDVRRSGRERKPVVPPRPRTPSPEKWSVINTPKAWPHPVVYPPQGARRVTVDFTDMLRLDEGEFLNDNLVSFALRRLEETMSADQLAKVHFFNSFFYPSLTTKFGKKSFNYDGVKKWTKSVDIFGKEGVIVPICIDMHWFVAIMCNLDNLRRKPAGDEDDGDVDVARDKVEPGSAAQSRAHSVAADVVEALESSGPPDDSLEITGSRPASEQGKPDADKMRKLTLSDDDKNSNGRGSAGQSREGSVFAFDDDGIAEPAQEASHTRDSKNGRQSTATSSKNRKKKSGPPPRKYDVDAPAIIVLDSFGAGHPAEVRNLKDYLVNEADDKRAITITRDSLQGLTAKGLPTQTNFCDCGVYLIGYIEKFVKDPEGFVRKVLSREMDEEADFADFDPSAKRAEIRDQLLKLQQEQEVERRAAKKEKASRAEPKKLVATKPVDTEAPPKPEAKVGTAIPQPKEAMTAQRPTQSATASRGERDAIERKGKRPPSDPTPPPATSEDEDDELEAELPRPLAPDTRRSKTPATESRGRTAPPASRMDNPDDGDMLDNIADAHEDGQSHGKRDSPQGKHPSSDNDLLTGLETAIQQGPRQMGLDGVAEEPSPGPTNNVGRKAKQTPKSEPSVIVIDSQSQHEIPDSQEATTLMPKGTWQGKPTGQRTVFH